MIDPKENESRPEDAEKPVPDQTGNSVPEEKEAPPSEPKQPFTLSEIDFDAAPQNAVSEETEQNTHHQIEKLRKQAKKEERAIAKEKKRKRRRGITILIISLSALLISVLIGLVLILGAKEFLGGGRESDTTITVEVPEGATADEIAELLAQNDIIEYPWFFKLMMKIDGQGSDFKAGSHDFIPHASYQEIFDELEENPSRTDVAEVTIIEGDTLQEVAAQLEEKGVCSASEFINAVNTQDFGYEFEQEVSDDPLKFYKMEGYIFPDKYQFYLNDSPENVAKKIFANFQSKIEPYLDDIEASGMTLEEVITLASVIQSEAGSEDQMPLTSSVFHNRLNNPSTFPHLESDVTVLYVENVIKPNLETDNEAMCNAYNTRVCYGLPVGAICNPGEAAIEAAIHPASSDYYFFVHDTTTGEVYFAETYAEHQANCRKLGIPDA